MELNYLKTLMRLGLLVFWLLLLSQTSGRADSLELSGEKGFNLECSTTESSNNLIFGQSLWLELTGQLGETYQLQGYLGDLPNAPRKFFLELSGDNARLRFGENKFAGFGSGLSNWQGDYNGLSGYLQNEQHRFEAVSANPITNPIQERIPISRGENLIFLKAHPLQAGTVQVSLAGRTLIPGVDYELDDFMGRLKLLFYPDTSGELWVDYQVLAEDTVSERFVALKEESHWGNYWSGLNYLNFQTTAAQTPSLLGERRSLKSIDLAGINLGGQVGHWRFGLEYWNDFEHLSRDWDYLDHMEGEAISSSAFGASGQPENWQIGSTGLGSLGLSEISPALDPTHTRNQQTSLEVNYQLLQATDQVSLRYNFESSRDLRQLSKFSFWVFGNGQPLELELAFLTTTNNYYHVYYPIKTLGWQSVECDLESQSLAKVGLPDWGMIYAIKLSLRSIAGEQAGTFYLAEFKNLTKSLAEQRWSRLNTTTGSSLKLKTIPTELQLTENNHQALMVEYNLAVVGEAALTYPFPIPVDLSNYQIVSFWAATATPLKLKLSLFHQTQEVCLGEVDLSADGLWHEYQLLLNKPRWNLQQLQAIKIALMGASTGTQILKLDELRVLGRKPIMGAAFRTTALFETEIWKHSLEYQTTTADYIEQTEPNLVPESKLKDTINYQGENYKLSSEVELAQTTDLLTKLPIKSEKFLLILKQPASEWSWWQNMAVVNSDLTADLGGNRLETGLAWQHNWSEWEFALKHQEFRSDLLENKTNVSNSLGVNYHQADWWLKSQVWFEDNFSEAKQNFLGINLGSSYDPTGDNSWQLNSGAIYERQTQTLDKIFCQSELIYIPTTWFDFRKTLKLNAIAQKNSASYLLDHALNWEMRITPLSEWQFILKQDLHLWHEQPMTLTRQHLEEISLMKLSQIGSEVKFYWHDDGVNDSLRDSLNNTFGFSSKLLLWQPWWTNLKFELKQERSFLPNVIVKDTYQGSCTQEKMFSDQLVAYGFGAEGVNFDWWRDLFNFAWEVRPLEGWQYGGRLDLGGERLSLNEVVRLVWGMGVFVTKVNALHQFNFKARYQNYANFSYQASLGYNFLKSEQYTIGVQGEYRQSDWGLKQLSLRSELLFYIH